jgi:hypothetical protein
VLAGYVGADELIEVTPTAVRYDARVYFPCVAGITGFHAQYLVCEAPTRCGADDMLVFAQVAKTCAGCEQAEGRCSQSVVSGSIAKQKSRNAQNAQEPCWNEPIPNENRFGSLLYSVEITSHV